MQLFKEPNSRRGKMGRKQIQGFAVVGLIVGLVFATGGCASSGGGETAAEKEPVAETSKEKTTPAKAAGVSVPANSKLAKVKTGMSEREVREAIGEADRIKFYPTGRNWNPFHFGGDTMRADWSYTKEGKVVFSNVNRWRRTMKVFVLRYDPDEP
jgi:hypothetical protein